MLGLHWSSPEPSDCRLRIRRPEEASELVRIVGRGLNYRADSEAQRWCIGHRSPRRNDGAYHECHNRPQPGERTCVSCSVAEAEFASDLHHAHHRNQEEIHQAVRRHLERPTVLYLAGFRDGSIKVGTSTDTRRQARWAEQGAWLAVEVAATTDGYVVRQLEDLVTAELGLPQAVATTRKVAGLVSPRDDERLQTELATWTTRVHDLLATAPTLGPSDDSPIEPDPVVEAERSTAGIEPTECWWRFPAAGNLGWDRPHRYPARLDSGHHDLIIDSVCGRVAAVHRPAGDRSVGDRFVEDLGQLFGRQIEIGDFQSDELLVQDSLF